MLADSRVRGAVVSGALLPTLRQALAQGGHPLETIVVVRPGAADAAGATDRAAASSGPDGTSVVSFDGALARGARSTPPAPTRADDVAFWLYSSGSTGRPKGTVHTHGNLYWTDALYARNVLALRSRRTSCSRLPSCSSRTASATR
jgi:benzoate-CoA ligase